MPLRFWVEAKSHMADIYKRHKKDDRAYTRCYCEIVEKSPGVKTLIMLGDAWLGIQEVSEYTFQLGIAH